MIFFCLFLSSQRPVALISFCCEVKSICVLYQKIRIQQPRAAVHLEKEYTKCTEAAKNGKQFSCLTKDTFFTMVILDDRIRF
jgi:hypothetical protein